MSLKRNDSSQSKASSIQHPPSPSPPVSLHQHVAESGDDADDDADPQAGGHGDGDGVRGHRSRENETEKHPGTLVTSPPRGELAGDHETTTDGRLRLPDGGSVLTLAALPGDNWIEERGGDDELLV